MAQVAQIGATRVQANIIDLQTMLEAEAQRLKQEQDKTASATGAVVTTHSQRPASLPVHQQAL